MPRKRGRQAAGRRAILSPARLERLYVPGSFFPERPDPELDLEREGPVGWGFTLRNALVPIQINGFLYLFLDDRWIHPRSIRFVLSPPLTEYREGGWWPNEEDLARFWRKEAKRQDPSRRREGRARAPSPRGRERIQVRQGLSLVPRAEAYDLYLEGDERDRAWLAEALRAARAARTRDGKPDRGLLERLDRSEPVTPLQFSVARELRVIVLEEDLPEPGPHRIALRFHSPDLGPLLWVVEDRFPAEEQGGGTR